MSSSKEYVDQKGCMCSLGNVGVVHKIEVIETKVAESCLYRSWYSKLKVFCEGGIKK